MILPQEIIRKKRDGLALSEDELTAFFNGYLRGEVADYQMGAMLMAICLKSMNNSEMAQLTRVMRDSGECFDWGYPKHLVVDKHSTGGIGDKTSIILLPLAVLCGLRVPMMAGRGLGHTGGTLDKLEALGLNVYPSAASARQQVEKLGGVFMGQTEKIVPLDRRLYSMRDVTATVESIPLIVGSILSKKLAEGLGGLVMDVKFGSGAFMRDFADAKQLAEALTTVGTGCGLKMRCMLTSMNSPLGAYAGNALEIVESLEVLRGDGPDDTRHLTLELTAEMVKLAFPQRQLSDIHTELEKHLASGAAFELFCKIVGAQGGDVRLLEKPQDLIRARVQKPVLLATGKNGARRRRISAIDVRKLGIAILELGGGRRLVTDKVDPWVGLAALKHVGDELDGDEPVAIVHGNDAGQVAAASALVAEAYQVADHAAPQIEPLIKARL